MGFCQENPEKLEGAGQVRRILVFDSGLGGLSVLAEIRRLIPDVALSYGCDSAGFPYGDWPKDALVQRIRQVVSGLIASERPDVVVIACNTASTAALAEIRQDHPGLPVIGTVPAIKPAAASSLSRVIGVLATPGTAASPYLEDLCQRFAAGFRVLKVGAPHLAELAEQFLGTGQVDPQAVAAEAAPLFADPALDTVVLGCTHYPLVLPVLQEVAPRAVRWLDSGEAIARQTLRVLEAPRLAPAAEPEDAGGHRVICTAVLPHYPAAFARMDLPEPREVRLSTG